MTSISHVTLETSHPAAAEAFYAAAFGLAGQIRVRASEEPTSGFRGYTLSLVVSQQSTVDSLTQSALANGATELKPTSTTSCCCWASTTSRRARSTTPTAA